jgi:hypothetical protein
LHDRFSRLVSSALGRTATVDGQAQTGQQRS